MARLGCRILMLLVLTGCYVRSGVALSSSSSASDAHLTPPPETIFSTAPPYLAIVTEIDSCDSEERLTDSWKALRRACNDSKAVSLVNVRINPKAPRERVLQLTRALVELRNQYQLPFRVVLNSDWRSLALEAKVDGIHFKEAHRQWIPSIQEQHPSMIIGTSTHSLESAIDAFEAHQPDYFFVGTCYTTASHPEKASQDLEGPALPGTIARALEAVALSRRRRRRPHVFAIGGIDASNCHEPIAFGANGIATIRTVLHHSDPAEMATILYDTMKTTMP